MKSYGGVLLITYREDHVEQRRLAGDTDRSDDYFATFTPDPEVLATNGTSERACLQTLARSLRIMADNIDAQIKRLKLKP